MIKEARNSLYNISLAPPPPPPIGDSVESVVFTFSNSGRNVPLWELSGFFISSAYITGVSL
jgi:hypothetical protein